MISWLTNYPLLTLVFTLVLMSVAMWVGQYLGRRKPPTVEDSKDLDRVTSASLTLLALIIGFSFSMAVGRYDLRKNYEEEEANAIGTEYVRAGLLPGDNPAKVREVLKKYLDQRLLWYEELDHPRVGQIDRQTAKLQDQMWTLVQDATIPQQTPTMTLVVSGMNDVLNRQGYSQAAWWNRIPHGAWTLMVAISLCCCGLVGYESHWKSRWFTMILPIIIAVELLPHLGHRQPTQGYDSGSTAKPDQPSGLPPHAVADPRSTAIVRLLWGVTQHPLYTHDPAGDGRLS